MDTRDLDAPGFDAESAVVLGGYLWTLQSRLPIGRRDRRQIVAELTDGLLCTMERHVHDGMVPADAARRAVAEFGEPTTLARQFARQLGPATAHRIGVGLVVSGPLVGLLWASAYADGAGVPSGIAALLDGLPQLAVILAMAVPAALLAATGAGRAAGHVRLPSRVVTGAAIVAAIGCVVGDVSLLSASVATHGWPTGWPASTAAVAAGLVRLTVAAWAAQRMARIRAAAR